jgi:hypothetical protein
LSSRAADVGPAKTVDVLALTDQTVLRVEQLPRGAGWLLITAGVVGVVVPGVPGAPFLLAGAVLLTPGARGCCRDGQVETRPNSSGLRCVKSAASSTTWSAAIPVPDRLGPKMGPIEHRRRVDV